MIKRIALHDTPEERRRSPWMRATVSLVQHQLANAAITTRAAADWLHGDGVPEHVALRVIAGREVRHV